MRQKTYGALLALLMLFASIPVSHSAQAAAEPDFRKDVFISDTWVIKKENGGKDLYSADPKWFYETMTIDAPPPGKNIIRVELRNKNSGELIRALPRVSDNKYQVGNVEGEVIELIVQEDIKDGYFEWFRAPERKWIWMYDLYDLIHQNQNYRHYFQNDGVYDRPQPNAQYASVAFGSEPPPLAPSTGYVPTSEGNIAWAKRTWNIKSSVMTSKDDLKIDITKVKEVKADLEYKNGGPGFVREILEKKVLELDLQKKWLDFNFRAKYDVEPFSKRPSEDGSYNIRYMNAWDLTLTGKVYLYHPMEVVAYYGDGDPEVPSPGGNSCSYTISPPSKLGSLNGNVMDPAANGVIRADQRGAEQFDVLLGIPTSESLYANAFGMNYLFQNQFTNMTGNVTFTVSVTKTYNLKWTEEKEGSPDEDGNPTTEEEEKSRTETVTKEYQVERPYSYWTIDNLEVYGIEKATMANYALPGGEITLTPTGYTPPTVEAENSDNVEDHVTPAPCESVDLGTEDIDGGSSEPSVPDEDFAGEADGAVGQNQVKNDYVSFDGKIVMDNKEATETAPTPGSIPNPTVIDQNVLYRSGMVISSSLINKANTPSTGTIYYNLLLGIKGGSPQQFPINGINTVTVHTPVVNYSSVSDDREHNQKVTPALDRSAVILDRPFVVTIPTSGQHRNIPGYGNRDYAKYVRQKQVWFPFDVYNSDQTVFYPKQQWIDIPVSQIDTTFFLPVWVDEGFYEVLFRTIAENAPLPFTTEPNANLDLAHHVATDVVKVDVIGRLYDFKITDIADFNWETVFRTKKGSREPTGNVYYVGDLDIDGDPRGNTAPFLLPIRPGSHPQEGYKNVAVKTGYTFSFDVLTKGNMFGTNDAVRITPSFDFVGKDGSSRQAVDLYYHTKDQYFIKIGSEADAVKIDMTLNSRLRNVPSQHLQQTASYAYDHDPTTPTAGMSRAQYVERFIAKSKKPTWIGKYSWLILTQQVRTLIGTQDVPAGVDASRKLAAEQQWYGEFSLPAAVYIVKEGTNIAEYGRTHNGIDNKSPIFLKDGYLIVNFNIETIRDKNLEHPHLRYYPLAGDSYPFDNQWLMEGFERVIVDPYGHTFQLRDGDIVFYHGNLSSYDDFKPMVTH